MASGFLNVLKNNKLMAATSAYAGISGFRDQRDKGAGMLGATAKGVSDAFLVDVIGFKAYVGAGLVMGTPKVAIKAVESMGQKARSLERGTSGAPFLNNTFIETEQTYTMREAGMQMAARSQMSTRKALMGNEAQYMHR